MNVVYSFTDDNELVIEYKGTTDKTTIVNMTNHGFFSLAGIANPTPTIENCNVRLMPITSFLLITPLFLQEKSNL